MSDMLYRVTMLVEFLTYKWIFWEKNEQIVTKPQFSYQEHLTLQKGSYINGIAQA